MEAVATCQGLRNIFAKKMLTHAHKFTYCWISIIFWDDAKFKFISITFIGFTVERLFATAAKKSWSTSFMMFGLRLTNLVVRKEVFISNEQGIPSLIYQARIEVWYLLQTFKGNDLIYGLVKGNKTIQSEWFLDSCPYTGQTWTVLTH